MQSGIANSASVRETKVTWIYQIFDRLFIRFLNGHRLCIYFSKLHIGLRTFGHFLVDLGHFSYRDISTLMIIA